MPITLPLLASSLEVLLSARNVCARITVVQGSCPGEGEVSWFFSSCGRKLVFYSQVPMVRAVSLSWFDRTLGLLSSCQGLFGVLLELWQGNQDASRVEAGNPESGSCCHRDLGLHIDFQGESIIVSC